MAVTSTPAALGGLTDGQTYTAQNVRNSAIYLRASASAPDATDDAWRIAPFETIAFRKDAGEGIYAWCGTDRTGRIVYDRVTE